MSTPLRCDLVGEPGGDAGYVTAFAERLAVSGRVGTQVPRRGGMVTGGASQPGSW
ncbi:hypothetical protein [Streptomyces narbonensis]|uniref:hypothetical protein n=1 Tax=Streptomyces narbonensis TaxID=67333 RepID=UPI0016727275|nr:hypothetical protein [Streptomyces narbonensis]